jgi:hypothetical protein
MPPLKKNKIIKEEKTTEQQKIQSTINSQSYCMIPMHNAEYVRFRNPLDGNDYHFSTKDSKFFEMLFVFAQKGMQEKILKDLKTFADNIDSQWNVVLDSVNTYFHSTSQPDSVG